MTSTYRPASEARVQAELEVKKKAEEGARLQAELEVKKKAEGKKEEKGERRKASGKRPSDCVGSFEVMPCGPLWPAWRSVVYI